MAFTPASWQSSNKQSWKRPLPFSKARSPHLRAPILQPRKTGSALPATLIASSPVQLTDAQAARKRVSQCVELPTRHAEDKEDKATLGL
jgi:hypothetical protein